MDLLVSSPDSFVPRTHQQVLMRASLEGLACLGRVAPGRCFDHALQLWQRWRDHVPTHYVEGWYLLMTTNEAAHSGQRLLLNASLTLSVHGWLEVEEQHGAGGIIDPTLMSVLLSSPEPPLWVLYVPAVCYTDHRELGQLLLEGTPLPLAHHVAAAAMSYLAAHQVAREIATACMDLAGEVHTPLDPDSFPRILARDLLRLPPLQLLGVQEREV
jgi:hypothetical protein